MTSLIISAPLHSAQYTPLPLFHYLISLDQKNFVTLEEDGREGEKDRTLNVSPQTQNILWLVVSNICQSLSITNNNDNYNDT